MLSLEEKRKQAVLVNSSDDIESTAKRSAMSRLITAVKSSDEAEALDALADLLELLES